MTAVVKKIGHRSWTSYYRQEFANPGWLHMLLPDTSTCTGRVPRAKCKPYIFTFKMNITLGSLLHSANIFMMHHLTLYVPLVLLSRFNLWTSLNHRRINRNKIWNLHVSNKPNWSYLMPLRQTEAVYFSKSGHFGTWQTASWENESCILCSLVYLDIYFHCFRTRNLNILHRLKIPYCFR